MSRPITLLAVLLALLLLGWGVATWTGAHMWGAEEEQKPTATDNRRDAGGKLTGDAEPAQPQAQPKPPHNDRQELPATTAKPRYEDIPDHEAVPVRVVKESDKQAVPGATVMYLAADFAAKLTAAQKQELQRQGLSPSEFLERFGFRARIDENGVARVRRSNKGTLVHGRFDQHIGQLVIGRDAAEPIGGWVLELRAEWTLRVKVIDKNGAPLAGIPVYITGTPFSRWLGVTREPDGILEREQASQLLKQLTGNKSVRDMACYVRLPGLEDARAPLDPARPPKGDLRIQLPETGSIKVQVLDSRGRTVSSQTRVAIETAPGRATDPSTQISGAARAGKTIQFPKVGIGKRYRLTALINRLTTAKVIQGPTAAGQEVTAQLRLPASGKIQVTFTDPKGQPITGASGYVNLQKKDHKQTYQQHHFDEKGTATFDWVPLGETWQLTVWGPGPRILKQVVGPARAGETVPVQISMADDIPVLIGRAIDVDGKPWVKRTMTISIDTTGRSGGMRAVTDKKGRFQVALGKHLVGAPIKRFELLLKDKRGGGNTGESATPTHPPSFPAGITDLGDVVLKKPPLILAGKLQSFKPNRRASPPWLGVERHRVHERRGVRRESWRSDRSIHLTLNGSNFEFRGVTAPGRLRLKVRVTGYLPMEPIEFTIGTRDLQVPLVKGGSVLASVMTEQGMNHRSLRALLFPIGGQPEDKRSGQGQARRAEFHGGGPHLKPGQVEFRWIGLQPGVYRMEIGPMGIRPPPLIVDNVQVVAGKETRDPRLQGLDLRGRLKWVTLTIQTPDGKPLRQGWGAMALVRPAGALTDLEGQPIDRQGRVKLALGPSPLRVLVIARGYPVKDVAGIVANRAIQLDPSHAVRVRVRDGGPGLPAGANLQLHLSSTRPPDPAAKGLRYTLPRGSGLVAHILQPGVDAVAVVNSVAVFQVPTAGEYRVTAFTRGGARRLSLQAKPATIQIKPTRSWQEFEVELSERAAKKR